MWLVVVFIAFVAVAARDVADTSDEHGCPTNQNMFWCVAVGNACEDAFAKPPSCRYRHSLGASFDLSPLRQVLRDYTILDEFTSHEHDYSFTYVFNVCANAEEPEPVNEPDACATTEGSASDVQTGPAPAFQYYQFATGNYACYRLGGDIYDATTGSDTNIEFGVLDESNPAHGVYIEYAGGNLCRDNDHNDVQDCPVSIKGQAYCPRALRLEFTCDNTGIAIEMDDHLDLKGACIYVARFATQYACPLECGRANGAVCNDHGMCAYMASSGEGGAAECLCESPFAGDDCSGSVVAADTGATSAGTSISNSGVDDWHPEENSSMTWGDWIVVYMATGILIFAIMRRRELVERLRDSFGRRYLHRHQSDVGGGRNYKGGGGGGGGGDDDDDDSETRGLFDHGGMSRESMPLKSFMT